MKLKKIKIMNYRQFVSTTINLDESISILAGANNSGKTSLVELIKKVFSNSSKKFSLDDIPVTVAKTWSELFYGELYKIFTEEVDSVKVTDKIIPLIFESTEDGVESTCIIMDKLSVEAEVAYEKDDPISKFADYLMDLDEDVYAFFFQFEYKLNNNKFLSLLESNFHIIRNRIDEINELKKENNDKDIIIKETAIKNLIIRQYITSLEEKYYFTDKDYIIKELIEARSFKSLFCIQSITANRLLDDESSDTKNHLSKKMIDFVSSDEDWNELLNTLPEKIIGPIELSGVKESIRDKSLNGLSDAIKSISKTNGGRAEQISLDMDVENEDINNLLKRITSAKYIVDNHYLRENAQGLGYSNMIYMHLELEKFIKEVDTTTVNLYIIEEPEAHMHPQMQKTFMKHLVDFLSNKEIQGFITTHSSEIIKVSKIPKIRVIRKVDTFENRIYDMNIFMTKISSRNPELEKFFNLLFNINFADIIFADKVIMYEGDTERMYVQKVLDLNEFKSLKEQYISYIQVGGAYAHNYKELIEYFKIKCLILTDIDYTKSYHEIEKINGSFITNAAIKAFYKEAHIDCKAVKVKDLYDWSKEPVTKVEEYIKLKYQTDQDHHSRTLEEAMLSKYFELDVSTKKTREIWEKMRTDHCLLFSIPRDGDEFYVRQIVNSSSNKKTDFMYSVILNSLVEEMLPNYIKEGLLWLK